MRLQLLDLAGADLLDGYRFYERQAEGWDPISWKLWSRILSRFGYSEESIGVCLDTIGCSRIGFRTLSITKSTVTSSTFGVCSIAGEIPNGYSGN